MRYETLALILMSIASPIMLLQAPKWAALLANFVNKREKAKSNYDLP